MALKVAPKASPLLPTLGVFYFFNCKKFKVRLPLALTKTARVNVAKTNWRAICPYASAHEKNSEGRTWISSTYKKSIHGARRRGIPFTLTPQEYAAIWSDTCALCGLHFQQISALAENFDRLKTRSIDRIDSTKGYEAGNVQFLCYGCNATKGNSEPPFYKKKGAAACFL